MASTDQTVTGVPGRYASALFDLAKEDKSVDTVQAQLAGFRAAIEGSADLKRLVTSPAFSSADQIAAIDAICAKAKIGGTASTSSASWPRTAAFRRFPPSSRRSTRWSPSRRRDRRRSHLGRQALRCPAQGSQGRAQGIDGRDVTLSTRVDSSLLGGLIVKVGSRMMDNSLKTKLQNLKIAMKGTA